MVQHLTLTNLSILDNFWDIGALYTEDAISVNLIGAREAVVDSKDRWGDRGLTMVMYLQYIAV